MTIFILANGGENIGMGHIMRTLVLAKELKKKYMVKYVVSSKKEFETGVLKIIEEGMEYTREEDLEVKKGDVLIIDKYDIKVEKLKEYRNEGVFTVLIDDNNILDEYPVDIVINQNLYAKKINYNKNIKTKFLLGSEYVLLRDEFRKKKKNIIRENIEEIMLTIGGSDNNGLTERILGEIGEGEFNIHVVIGEAFKNKKLLKEQFKDNKKIIFYENAQMSEIMGKVDICISACGSTLYELSFLGIPIIGIVVAENQKNMGEYLKRNNLANISEIDELTSNIKKMNFNKRNELSENTKKLIDGLGVKRIEKNIVELYSCKYKN